MIVQNRFRILYIVKGIDIGGNSGGAESFGIRLAQSLRAHNQDVSICAYLKYGTSVEKYWQDQLEKMGIQLIFANSSNKIYFNEARKTINNWLNDHPVDIVHSHYQVGTITLAILKSFHKYHLLIRTAHIDSEFGSSALGLMSRLLFRGIVYPVLVDYEIGVSRAITYSLNLQILRKILRKQAIWIPNAIPERIDTSIPDILPEEVVCLKTDTDWIITYIGILAARKKIDILIHSMVEVLKQVPQAKLVIVGGGSELNSLIHLSQKLGVSESCWFLGQQQNINSILKTTNILVLPSSSEGFSTVILEAMQNKVPVIVTDIPGNRELIENDVSGWLVPVGDIGGLAQAIIKAYRLPGELKRMAENAYSQAMNYSMSRISDQYLSVYLSLLKRQ